MLLAKIKEALSSLYDDIQETPEVAEPEVEASESPEEVAADPAAEAEAAAPEDAQAEESASPAEEAPAEEEAPAAPAETPSEEDGGGFPTWVIVVGIVAIVAVFSFLIIKGNKK